MSADLFVPFAEGVGLARSWRGFVDIRAAVAGTVALVAAGIRVGTGSQAASSLALAIAIGALIIAFALVYVQLRKRNAGIYFRDQRVGVADALARRRGVKVGQLDHLQRCAVQSINVTNPIRLLLFVEPDRRVALRFYGADGLTPGGIEDLAERSGLSLQGSWDDVYAPAELQTRYPGALPKIQRVSYGALDHPKRTAWLAGGVTVFAFVVLAVVLLSRSAH
jgi:hypothetical protein